MCGIAGFNWEDAELLRKMTDALVHRGPDAGGTFVSSNTLSLGHRRLSIVDLHERSNQPLHYSHAGRAYTLVFNGEIYNFRALRAELERLGFAFSTQTDSEVILAAYAAWGDDCLRRFNGMWAFALFDATEQKLLLSRDRFGKKPLYYHAADGRLVFASEIKAVLLASGVRRVADHERVIEFLTFGIAHNTDRTFFRDVRQLPAGSSGVLDLRSGRFRTKRYYSPRVDERSVAPDEIGEALRAAVERRLISDVPVCLSLSGGVDSATIAALIARIHDGRMLAFTTTSAEGPGDETANVNELLKLYPQFELVKVPLALNDLRRRLTRIIHHMDEPFLYDSPFVRWTIAEAIHQRDFKVALTGEGADELLGGYSISSPLYLLDQYRKRRFGKLAIEAAYTLRQPDWRKIFDRVLAQFVEERRRCWSRKFVDTARRYGFRLDPVGTGSPLQGHDVTLKEKLLTQVSCFFLPYLLACNDKMYMAHSVEARAPFLDVEVAELCLSVSTDQLMKRGYRKYPLRAAMHGKIPDSVLFDRHKVGFASPMRAQFGTADTKSWVRELFREPRSDTFIDPRIFVPAYEGLASSAAIDDFFANSVVLELWMREFDVLPE
jgi:asparagine synthase (glutamine-hydrolysing)